MDLRCKQVQHGVELSAEQFEVVNGYLNGDVFKEGGMVYARDVILGAELPSNAEEFYAQAEKFEGKVVLYRGMSGDWEENTPVSWTTDAHIACSFLERYGEFEVYGNVAVVALTLEELKAGMVWAVEATDGFEEFEVIMRPEFMMGRDDVELIEGWECDEHFDYEHPMD